MICCTVTPAACQNHRTEACLHLLHWRWHPLGHGAGGCLAVQLCADFLLCAMCCLCAYPVHSLCEKHPRSVTFFLNHVCTYKRSVCTTASIWPSQQSCSVQFPKAFVFFLFSTYIHTFMHTYTHTHMLVQLVTLSPVQVLS